MLIPITHPDIGSALRYYRERAGLTREQAATHVGRTTQTIREWETGNRTPRLVFLVELAKLYQVECVELLAAAVPGLRRFPTGDRQEFEAHPLVAATPGRGHTR